MDFKKHALILGVIEGLNKCKSWTGKTHVQKALSLIYTKGDIALPFQFILYKHGPYSFDVEEEMEQMRGYSAVVSESVPGYGVQLCPGSMAEFVKKANKLSPDEKRAIEQVCAFVGSRNVAELERIATAAWIRTQEQLETSDKVAERLHQLKPHVTIQEALDADKEVASFIH